MDKINQFEKNLSLKKSIILYITLFAIIAILLSAETTRICKNTITKIQEKYPMSGERYYLTNEMGEQLGEGTIIGTEDISFSKKDHLLITWFEILPIIATPTFSALCVIATALFFYHKKLKEPLTKLKIASEKISMNDLDFQIDYSSKNELGQLCASFEIMRSTLANNFSEMWRQMEERKQLHAAFAHDLRTPLTVLKGYNEILQTSREPTTKDTAITMGKHIFRLERYIDSMSHLHRLEDAQPKHDIFDINSYIATIIDSAKLLCEQHRKTLCIQNNMTNPSICIDGSFVSQVHNNLISNALRYAKSNISICYANNHNGLSLSISDDGCGFSKDTLRKATNPYFTEEENHSEHFGLGLYICKILCEHHSGYLKIENNSTGAKVTAFFKSLDL